LPAGNHADEAASLYVSLSFARPKLNLLDLAQIMTDLDDVYGIMAQFVYFQSVAPESGAEAVRPLEQVRQPTVVSISLDSPLILQLMVGAAAVPSLRAFAQVIRDPQKLGSYIPKVRSSYFDAKAEEQKARERLRELRAGGEIEVKEAQKRIKVKQPVKQSRKKILLSGDNGS